MHHHHYYHHDCHIKRRHHNPLCKGTDIFTRSNSCVGCVHYECVWYNNKLKMKTYFVACGVKEQQWQRNEKSVKKRYILKVAMMMCLVYCWCVLHGLDGEWSAPVPATTGHTSREKRATPFESINIRSYSQIFVENNFHFYSVLCSNYY